MSTAKLTRAPLVEAIVELRWRLSEPAPGIAVDPRYKLLVGRLYDRLAGDYPFHEPLPTASMPDEMLGYVVQHRFRVAEGQWPLVQVGPGLVTLNATEGYEWKDFETRSHQLLDSLYAAYPEAQKSLAITSLQLRYIDAVLFDFERESIFEFMASKLKIGISFPAVMFGDAPIHSLPAGLNALFLFPIHNPAGTIRLRFARGTRHGKDALIWETIIQSDESDMPDLPAGFRDWLTGAHVLTHDLFFKLIAGELEESFQ